MRVFSILSSSRFLFVLIFFLTKVLLSLSIIRESEVTYEDSLIRFKVRMKACSSLTPSHLTFSKTSPSFRKIFQ
jgi:hypothetical protein